MEFEFKKAEQVFKIQRLKSAVGSNQCEQHRQQLVGTLIAKIKIIQCNEAINKQITKNKNETQPAK